MKLKCLISIFVLCSIASCSTHRTREIASLESPNLHMTECKEVENRFQHMYGNPLIEATKHVHALYNAHYRVSFAKAGSVDGAYGIAQSIEELASILDKADRSGSVNCDEFNVVFSEFLQDFYFLDGYFYAKTNGERIDLNYYPGDLPKNSKKAWSDYYRKVAKKISE